MTLALYGGSFNPPHNGHVLLAKSALAAIRPGKLIWMPSGAPPHKELPAGTPSAAHLLAMSRLAAEGLPNTEVSAFELTGGARYTIDTVTMLLERYKPDTLWLLMGSDMWDAFDTWHRADDLRRLVEVYTFPRNRMPVSSTEARSLLAQGLGDEMIPKKVREYIQREGLYGCPKP